MSQQHTKEPWRVDGTKALGAYGVWTDYGTHSGDVPGELYPDQICSVYPNNTSHFDRETRDANARRIVACVNALAGIPTPALEAGLLGEVRAILDRGCELMDRLGPIASNEGHYEIHTLADHWRNDATALAAKLQ